jgi:HK97 family phage major capsid protein
MSLISLETRKTALINSLSALAMRGLKTKEEQDSYRRSEDELSLLETQIVGLRYIESKIGTQAQQTQQAQQAQQIAALPSEIVNDLQRRGAIAPVVPTGGTDARNKAIRTLRQYFVTGSGEGASREVRDLVSDVDTQGQALVQQEYVNSITRAAAYVSPIVNLISKEVYKATGRSTRWPVADDTGRVASLVADGANTPAPYDPVLFSTASASSDPVVSKVAYSYQFAQDVANWEAFLDAMAGETIARAVSSGLLLGKDQIGNVLPNQSTGGLIGNSPKGATSASATALSYQDLTNLAASVNLEYYNKGVFLVGASTYQYLLAQVDSTGRALYKIDEATGQLKVAGKLVYAANELNALGASNVPVALFGDFSKAYGYAQGSTNITVSRETHVDVMIVEAFISHRFSGQSLVASAVKSLWTPAAA